MQRKLFIIRHGKSSWDHPDLDDIERPLAGRGTRNANEMAHRLKSVEMVPGLIFTSPAVRALGTARIMAGIWNIPPEDLQIHDELYMAYVPEIREVVGRAPAGAESLAVFGHNPSFTLYANSFLDEPLANLPTAGVVIITLESGSWERIGRNEVVNTYVDIPKRKLT